MISELTNMGISPSAFRLLGVSIRTMSISGSLCSFSIREVIIALSLASYAHTSYGISCSPYFSDVGFSALHDGVLEVAVYHHNPYTLCHQIVGKGDAECSLSNASLLIGECHYNRSLYHFKY